MQSVFDMILGIEGRMGRYSSETVLTAHERNRMISAVVDDVVECLCAPELLIECGWERAKPRYSDTVEIAYSMCWTDESATRAYAYQLLIGEPFRRRGRTSEKPLFHYYELTVRQKSLSNGTVWCGLELCVYAQYRNGTRIQVRHLEIGDTFPCAVRFTIIDGDSLPDDISINDYPYAALLALFDVVMERVVCERE